MESSPAKCEACQASDLIMKILDGFPDPGKLAKHMLGIAETKKIGSARKSNVSSTG